MPREDLNNGLNELRSLANSVDSELKPFVGIDVPEITKAHRAIREDNTRSRITVTIVFAFVACVASVIVAALFGVSTPENLSAASSIVEKTALPIVTLVLGYYFGSSRG